MCRLQKMFWAEISSHGGTLVELEMVSDGLRRWWPVDGILSSRSESRRERRVSKQTLDWELTVHLSTLSTQTQIWHEYV